MTVHTFMRMDWLVHEPDVAGWVGKDIPDELYDEYMQAYAKFCRVHQKLNEYDDVEVE